ncbi:MAG TPA: UDP-N-acetylglucosamine 2-epimerase (non-hydrolyzing) [Anaerolineales bacterium]|nr:UDP-N-acetylglucosamine 2-epimerase (non-hydrolyzing) [Anaerolineales bacterium]
MSLKTVCTVVGARPQFIKAAPVSRALAGSLREVLIHTGQHYDYGMSEVFFEEMEMRPPDFHLGAGGGTHAEQTGKMLIEIEKILNSVKPGYVLVYGDTNSTLAGALAAAKLQIPLAHVEAGLRSYNRAMPEEINRVLTDHVSSLLFCPTEAAIENLAKEGITQGVHHVGDVMYDALLHNLVIARKRSTVLQSLGLERGAYALATVHRAANTDDPARMAAILDALKSLPIRVIFPVHPRTRKMIQETGLSVLENVRMIEPVGYFDMLILQENANCILTDSGGMQKEAYLLGVRCITLREETEWVETVQAGWNKLTGVDGDAIREAFDAWHPSSERPALYGNGNAAGEICGILSGEFL